MRKRHLFWIIPVAGLVLCGGGGALVAGAVGGGAAVVEKASDDRAKNITITSCKPGEFETVEISYTIKNSAETGQQYFPQFTVSAKDGTIVGEAADATAIIPAGATYKGKAIGTVDGSQKSVTCKLGSA